MDDSTTFHSSKEVILAVVDYYEDVGQRPFLRADSHANWNEGRKRYTKLGNFPANALVYYYQSICVSPTSTATPIDGIYLVTPQHSEFNSARIIAHLYNDSTKSVFCALVEN